MKRNYLVFMLISFFLSGCASSVGVPMIPRDRFDYSNSIADSFKDQTLLNIVKIRYMDLPVFVEVAQVNMGYELTGGVNVSGLNVPQSADINSLFALGGTANFSDRPNITYRPIKGKEFTQSFMTPVPPSAILFLMQNGWPADLVLPLTVDSINGGAIRNFMM